MPNKKKPQIGEIWLANFSDGHAEYYTILDKHEGASYTTIHVGSGIIQSHRYIDWQHKIWQKVA